MPRGQWKEGAGYPALAREFADIADIDQHQVVTAGKFDCLRGRHGLHLLVGGVD